MSVSATGPEVSLSEGARRQNALSLLLFLLMVVAFLTRFCIPPELMNRVMDYTSENGAIYEKLHAGTYLILFLAPLALFCRPIFLRGDEIGKFKALLRYCGILVILVVFLIGTGRAGSSGTYIDTYLIAGAAGLTLFSVNEAMRRMLGNVILVMLILSALIGVGEAATRFRLLPYTNNELSFRPTGLTDHPLTLGMMCATGIGFVALARWPIWTRAASILLLFVGAAASGARFSLLLAAAEILALVIFVPWTQLSPRHARQAKAVVLLGTLVLGAALVAVLFAGGFLSRFGDTLFDENAAARITIYRVFEFTGWKELLFGADLNMIVRIVNEELGLPFIESTPVYLTYQLGLPLALAFAALVFWIFGRMLRGSSRTAWIATAIFFLTALSNNTLSSKTPVVAIVLVLIIAFGASNLPAEDRRTTV